MICVRRARAINKMGRKLISLTLVLIMMLPVLTGCSTTDNPGENIKTTLPQLSDAPPIEIAELPTDSPNPDITTETYAYPLYLPLPYYHTFYDTIESGNIDAFLHNTAVNYYSTRVKSTSGDLLIPSLRLLDEWDAGDGDTYYLCHWVQYDYYDLAPL